MFEVSRFVFHASFFDVLGVGMLVSGRFGFRVSGRFEFRVSGRFGFRICGRFGFLLSGRGGQTAVIGTSGIARKSNTCVWFWIRNMGREKHAISRTSGKSTPSTVSALTVVISKSIGFEVQGVDLRKDVIDEQRGQLVCRLLVLCPFHPKP